MPDAHKNFAYSTIDTPPVPALTGTSLTVALGSGVLFPAIPFNVTVWPAATQPLASNAEVLRVISIFLDDIWTIVRAQEGSTARAILVGDQIAATITNKTLTDVEVLRVDGGSPLAADNLYDAQIAFAGCDGGVPG